MKIGIVGAGNVGATIAYTLSIKSRVSEIVIVDKNLDKARGEVLDLRHGLPFIPFTEIGFGPIEALQGMDAIIITAGLPRKPEETRLDLARRNCDLFKSLIPEIAKVNDRAIYLVVSNPVDVMTYAAIKYSGKPPSQVIGSGNVLDSARFRSMLGDFFKVDPSNVHAYVLGEHGQSCFPFWSNAFVGCTPLRYLDGYDKKALDEVFEEVKSVSSEIIRLKGATYYAVSLGVEKILQAIHLDQNKVLPVSTYLTDYEGASDICLSVPCVVNGKGIERVLKVPFDEAERKQFRDSASVISRIIEDLGLRKK